MSKFTEEDWAGLSSVGNDSFNRDYMSRFNPRDNMLPTGNDINKLKEFIRQKYIDKKWHKDGATSHFAGSSQAASNNNFAAKESATSSSSSASSSSSTPFGSASASSTNNTTTSSSVSTTSGIDDSSRISIKLSRTNVSVLVFDLTHHHYL
jgi:hypothetical protein